MRARFQTLFLPRRVPAYRAAVQRRADALIDAIDGKREMDLVRDFARPLPFSVIAGILGVPTERHAWLGEKMTAIGLGFARQREPEFVRRASAATVELQAYYAAELESRATANAPEEDVLSILAQDMPEEPEARADIVANCIFFVEAGHATTASLIAGGTLLMLQDPVAADLLRQDPTRVASAVEEMLRLVTPLAIVPRIPREDVEVAGCPLRHGEMRFAFLAAANRDAAVFPEPDAFEPARNDNRHLAFAAGAHFCLGAPLARLHGEIATATLLRRIPTMKLDGEPEWRGSLPLRELERLPVKW